MRLNNISKLIVTLIVCQGAGVIGSFFTGPAISTWYAEIQKPSFNPPNWVFAPVWIALFFLMGVSAYLILKRGIWKKNVFLALAIFGAQLGLNVFWSYLFFGLHSPLYALIEILILWLFILLTIVKFYKISRVAAFLLLPYILWVSFAAVLNFAIYRLNM